MFIIFSCLFTNFKSNVRLSNTFWLLSTWVKNAYFQSEKFSKNEKWKLSNLYAFIDLKVYGTVKIQNFCIPARKWKNNNTLKWICYKCIFQTFLVNNYSREKTNLVTYEVPRLKSKFPQGCWYHTKLNPSDEAKLLWATPVAMSIPNGIISAERYCFNFHMKLYL